MKAHLHGGPKDDEIVDLPDAPPKIYAPGDPTRPPEPEGYEVATYAMRRPTLAHRLDLAERGLPHIDACFVYTPEEN